MPPVLLLRTGPIVSLLAASFPATIYTPQAPLLLALQPNLDVSAGIDFIA